MTRRSTPCACTWSLTITSSSSMSGCGSRGWRQEYCVQAHRMRRDPEGWGCGFRLPAAILESCADDRGVRKLTFKMKRAAAAAHAGRPPAATSKVLVHRMPEATGPA